MTRGRTRSTAWESAQTPIDRLDAARDEAAAAAARAARALPATTAASLIEDLAGCIHRAVADTVTRIRREAR